MRESHCCFKFCWWWSAYIGLEKGSRIVICGVLFASIVNSSMESRQEPYITLKREIRRLRRLFGPTHEFSKISSVLMNIPNKQSERAHKKKGSSALPKQCWRVRMQIFRWTIFLSYVDGLTEVRIPFLLLVWL